MTLLEDMKDGAQAAIIEHPSAKKHPMANVFDIALKRVVRRAKEYTANDDTETFAAIQVIEQYIETHDNEVDVDVANKETVDPDNSQNE